MRRQRGPIAAIITKGLQKNSTGMPEFYRSAHLDNRSAPCRILKTATFSPAQPRRAKTRRSTGKAAASEDPRRYPPHFVGPFAIRMDLGERKSPYSDSGLREAPPQRCGSERCENAAGGLFQHPAIGQPVLVHALPVSSPHPVAPGPHGEGTVPPILHRSWGLEKA